MTHRPRRPSRRSDDEKGLRAEMEAVSRRLAVVALSPGRSGNFSARLGDGMLITPSGVPYDAISAADFVFVDADGHVRPGQMRPSSEWRMHLAILSARPDCAGIVHAHSLHATALACLHRPIPAFHYMVAAFGGDRIACAPYATFGSPALARHAVKALGPRHGCLLANHGSIALGVTLREALDRALELEALAAQYLLTLQAGKPRLLSRKDMQIVLGKFRTYGQGDDQGAAQ